MNRKIDISRSVDKSIVFCETINRVASKAMTNLLTEHSVSYYVSWSRVPFYKRSLYKGAENICTIYINRNEYTKARRVLAMLDSYYYDYMYVNSI